MKHIVIEKILSNSPHLSWIDGRTVLLVRHGSHAYGTNTETSDEDFKGIAVPPLEYFLGSINHFEQAELKEPDAVIYDIRKFFILAAECNPNIIEVLHTDPSDHFIVDPIGEIILEHKNDFLSKKIKHTFLGYSVAQLKRIKAHKRWIMNPPKTPPTRAELGLPEHTLIPQDQLMAAYAEVQKELDRFQFDFMEGLDEPTKIGIQETMTNMLAELRITADQHWQAAARKIGMDDNIIQVMQREREYSSKKKEWDQYQNWKKTRNPARAALEEKFGYDCYVDETEFLTENGWKKFDDITNTDKLATVYLGNTCNRKYMGVEYQNFQEKFDGTFSGNLYNLFGNHLDVQVTPNHRMIIQKEERMSGLKYEWGFEEISNLPDTFNIIRAVSPNIKNYSNKDIKSFIDLPIPQVAYLRLMGWYLSDGSLSFSENNEKIKCVSISQKKNGKLYSSMKKFANKYKEVAGASMCEYTRKPNLLNPRDHIEATLKITNNTIRNNIYNDCSCLENKRIPRWVFGLSKYYMEILLDAMMRGDGTKYRPDNGLIYYSSLKSLADDVQELALLCGFETSLYGPYLYENQHVYDTAMYQVHINKTRSQYKKCVRSKNIKTIPVKNKRIVCFSVPNSTLITRLNGHISIQGNSKHAYHLVRLIRMCREILMTGKVLVKRPDREELLAIRNGSWTYEQLIEFAEKEDQALNELYNVTTVLPKSPDKQKIDQLCIKLVERSLSKYSWYNVRKDIQKLFDRIRGEK